jgi:hypothetical protein
MQVWINQMFVFKREAFEYFLVLGSRNMRSEMCSQHDLIDPIRLSERCACTVLTGPTALSERTHGNLWVRSESAVSFKITWEEETAVKYSRHQCTCAQLRLSIKFTSRLSFIKILK